ncbi:putative ABC transporter C family member 15 [Senna tora]|uniref:Putative ABC transporter C family member 15 n=1 Tax=Senna tora TaxID=362788 RepID=A0A834WVV3_9FABA|nr:putative ABC transporter C family member 15 [Senna tora]
MAVTYPSASGIAAMAAPKLLSLFSSSSQMTSVKLDRSNYLLWEAVVMLLIRGNSLEAHVDGTEAAPAPLIPGFLNRHSGVSAESENYCIIPFRISDAAATSTLQEERRIEGSNISNTNSNGRDSQMTSTTDT